MDQPALNTLLADLIATWENEVVEFKQADNDYSTNDIGKYFSALSNEANLRGQERAWLVFGVNNKTRSVVGTNYREQPERLHSLKQQVAQSTEPSVTFRDIHVLHHPDGRVLMFEIPAAPRGIPIAWKGHYHARAGESLGALGLDKHDEIRDQTLAQDWSAQRVPAATLADLDEAALTRAREAFAQKYANRFSADEVMGWPLTTFLDRARITQNGQITRTALLLLGKPESVWHLSPHPAQMTWKLEGAERAYQHFAPPFLLTTTRLYQRIRNIQLRLLPQDELLPIEVSKYDQKIVLEALHNCIAHQDYSRNGRVVVIEQPDRLVFENEGNFFDGAPGDYLEGNRIPRRYRNPFLAQAMAELNMIDTMGYGIHDMYARQAKRYFPMPDFDLAEPSAVRLTIYGSVVDPAYSRLLIQKTDLPLADVLALDRVQKKLPIPDEAVGRLKRAGLIEGRKPRFHVSASVAKATGNMADYIRTRAQDDEFYAKLLTDYLRESGQASRAEIDKLLIEKLSDALTPEQKQRKIGNLLTKLRRRGRILNAGSRGKPEWKLAE
ncbi:RNA-binding domain-containing protein [Spongiibacter tropicus]|jgi:ATP-dependent DNA helicase RecG|uniref:RNA-binding domain-containing protein n=1 Tax=Spongiibacter tropicus TaxID=454602 RepID=UPI000C908680|nr:RNA-binding domain-containing protein [Spongiibacter tropicus]MAP76246.1 transcriptional regulator [Pseudomonadales bacterium]|tara:strand:+ start:2644 stop:4302 length:1659 start_codon:yes stop_codon:yes gene_type:complete